MKKKYFYIILVYLQLITIISCSEEFLDTKPSQKLSNAHVFESFENAQGLLDGIYKRMYRQRADKFYDLCFDVVGEDVVVFPGTTGGANDSPFANYYNYKRMGKDFTISDGFSFAYWSYYYSLLYAANDVISNFDDVPAELDRKNYLKGQAYALRAYFHFRLVQMYQHTYVGHESELSIVNRNNFIVEDFPLSTVEDIYNQITADLDVSIEAFGNSIERLHISHVNVNVAKGIYAQVALVKNDWVTADRMAREARVGYTLMSDTEYKNGFHYNDNSEWMWGFIIGITDNSFKSSKSSYFPTIDITIPSGTGSQKNVGNFISITKNLYDQMDDTDVRKSTFDIAAPGVKSSNTTDGLYSYDHHPFAQLKFTHSADPPNYYYGEIVKMRAAEMYLIQAEALAELNRPDDAKRVLTQLVSARYSGYDIRSITDKNDIINEILKQRKLELWGEGHSFFDIKRRKLPLTKVLGPYDHNVHSQNSLGAEDDLFILNIPSDEVARNRFID